jgi:hypothetical protein
MAKFVRKLLNVRLSQTLKFAEITALVPFSTATPVSNKHSLAEAVAKDCAM